MAYHNGNYLKKIATIKDIYNQVKEVDKPDTFIVSKIFPKHNIHISYRGWMFIKSYGKTKEDNSNQLDLFRQSA